MSEHAEQVMVFAWAELYERRYPELKLLHAVQNWAGVKSARDGVRRKREGVKAGVPDIHLPVARGGYHSLYIEMKRLAPRLTVTRGVTYTPTKQTAEQVKWAAALTAAGNMVALCWTADEAQRTIEDYLNGEYERDAKPAA